MAEDRTLSYGSPLPATWLAAIQEYIGTMAANFSLSLASNTTVQVVAGTLSAQVAIGIDGLFRYISSTINAAVSGAAGQYDIFVTTGPNSYTAGTGGAGETDNTNYAFGLAVLAAGTTPTTSTTLTNFRRVGQLDWDGTNITHLRQFFGVGDSTQPLMPTADTASEIPLRVIGAASQAAALATWEAAGTTVATMSAAGALSLTSVTATGKSSLAGGATTVTPAAGDNSTNVATTAFVKAAAPVTSVFGRTGAVVAVTGDYSVTQVTGAAPLASPSFTGTATAAGLSVTGNASVGGTLTVTGDVTINGVATTMTTEANVNGHGDSHLNFWDQSAPSGAQRVRAYNASGTFSIQALDDAYANSYTALSIGLGTRPDVAITNDGSVGGKLTVSAAPAPGDSSTQVPTTAWLRAHEGAVRVVTAATTITQADRTVDLDGSGAAFSQPLPAAASFVGKLTLIASATNANVVTLTGNGSETFTVPGKAAQATLQLGSAASGAPYQAVDLVPDTSVTPATWRVA